MAGPNISWGAMLLTWPRLLGVYALHPVWPVHLSVSYDFPVEKRLWPLLLLIVVIAGLAWLLRDSDANIRLKIGNFEEAKRYYLISVSKRHN